MDTYEKAMKEITRHELVLSIDVRKKEIIAIRKSVELFEKKAKQLNKRIEELRYLNSLDEILLKEMIKDENNKD